MSEVCFWAEYCTDVGIKKKTNQDSLMIKVTEYEYGEVLLAAVDTRRNVLLQCIGVNEYIEPQFVDGNLQKDEEILLCSDGFRHAVTPEKIFKMLQTVEMSNEDRMKWALQELVEENKRRSETDNISAILINLEKLESLYLNGTNVSNADNILKLANLDDLEIEDTPLAENEEELQKIMEKFPELNLEY